MAAVVFAIMASGMFLLTFYGQKERVQPIKERKRVAERRSERSGQKQTLVDSFYVQESWH